MRSLLRRMNRTDPSDEAFSIGGQRKELKKVHDAGGIPDINFFSRGTAVQNQVDLNAATYGGTNPVQVNHVTATSVGVDINGSELLVPAMRRGTTSTKNLFLNTPRAMIEQKEVAAVPGTNRIDAAHVDMAHVFRNSIAHATSGGLIHPSPSRAECTTEVEVSVGRSSRSLLPCPCFSSVLVHLFCPTIHPDLRLTPPGSFNLERGYAVLS